MRLARRFSLFPLLLLTFLLQAAPAKAQAEPPDLPDGTNYELFMQRCANCHGPLGLGNGELAANLPNRPTAFDPVYLQTAVPNNMFNIITNGNVQAGMPLFGDGSSNPISEAERWSLVATLYGLGSLPNLLDAGQQLYEANDVEAFDLSLLPMTNETAGCWFASSNAQAAASLRTELAAQEITLSEVEASALAAYARTLTAPFAETFEPADLIDQGRLTGELINGSGGEVPAGIEITLQAFTPQVQEGLTLTTEADENGRFAFDLENLPADWFLLTTASYNALEFSSNIAQLSCLASEAAVTLPVFEQTDDATAVRVEQVQTILEFAPERVTVSEFYVFSNEANAVFVGSDGNLATGSIELNLPAGAQEITFQRAFGSIESMLPATEIVPTATGYIDAVPLRPGGGTTRILVRYSLPFEPGMTIGHPVIYRTEQVNVFVPDVGVTLAEDGWREQPIADLQSGRFRNYETIPGASVTYTLEGRPTRVQDAEGNMVLLRAENQELMVGIGAVVVAVVVAAGLSATWQAKPKEDGRSTDELLAEIAALDEAFLAGEIGRFRFERQRAKLKRLVMLQWSLDDA